MSQSTRAQRLLVLVAGSLLALTTACGSDDTPATTDAAGSSTAASSSAAASAGAASGSASATPSSGAAAATSAPAGGAATPGAPGTTGGAGTGTGTDGGATAPVPGAGGAVDPQVPVDPVKGQTFLEALRAGGLPPSPLDQVNLQYAPAVCQALAGGVSQQDILAQLAGVGQYYATQTSLSADQVAQLYVTSAQQTYC